MLRGLPPVVQLVKLMANPARAMTSRIFISSSGVLRTRMLLVTRASRRRRCRSWWWRYIPGHYLTFQDPVLKNINRSPIALLVYRTPVLALNSVTPFSVAPYLIAGRSYNVRGILIGLAAMVTGVPLLEQVYIPCLDGTPTVNRSLVRHQNRVLGEERGHGRPRRSC